MVVREQVVGGAAAPGHVTVGEVGDGRPYGVVGAEPGQGLGGGGEADGGGLAQLRIGEALTGRRRPQRIARGRAPVRPLREGLTVRYAVSAASGSSNRAVVTASGTIQPSSPGWASIIRSSR